MKKRNTHGGARKGSGRKSKGTIKMTIYVHPSTASLIRTSGGMAKCSHGEVIDSWSENLL